LLTLRAQLNQSSPAAHPISLCPNRGQNGARPCPEHDAVRHTSNREKAATNQGILAYRRVALSRIPKPTAW
jgi:hypothetical protein